MERETSTSLAERFFSRSKSSFSAGPIFPIMHALLYREGEGFSTKEWRLGQFVLSVLYAQKIFFLAKSHISLYDYL